MSKRRAGKKKKSLHHGAVEREMRRLHEMGASVEKQRDLIKSVLKALVAKLGGKVVVRKADFALAEGGQVDVDIDQKTGDLVVTVTPREGVKLGQRSWWQRFLDLFRRKRTTKPAYPTYPMLVPEPESDDTPPPSEAPDGG